VRFLCSSRGVCLSEGRSPDRQRLTVARAQLSTAIRRETAGHAARRPRLAVSLALRHRRLSRRWLGWAAPLAAAAAVTGVILGSQGAFSPVHRPVPSSSTRDPGPGLAHPATAYVAGQSGTVTPILTATGTALTPIRLADGAGPIAITPDGRTAYVIAGSGPGRRGTVTPIRTATNQVLRAIAVGNLPSVIAITPAPRR
jgi:DNA-binding beta-propeller fold protein YncE